MLNLFAYQKRDELLKSVNPQRVPRFRSGFGRKPVSKRPMPPVIPSEAKGLTCWQARICA